MCVPCGAWSHGEEMDGGESGGESVLIEELIQN